MVNKIHYNLGFRDAVCLHGREIVLNFKAGSINYDETRNELELIIQSEVNKYVADNWGVSIKRFPSDMLMQYKQEQDYSIESILSESSGQRHIPDNLIESEIYRLGEVVEQLI